MVRERISSLGEGGLVGVTAAAQKLLLPVSVWFLFLGSQSNQKKRPHITELTAGRTRQNHP